MKPVVLNTARLRLDCPSPADRARVVEYCNDAVFETFLTLPWPYRERDADLFLERLVPDGWEFDREYTWALREQMPSGAPSGVGAAQSGPAPAASAVSGQAAPSARELAAPPVPRQPAPSPEHPNPTVGPLLGVIGYRRTTSDIGFWLGAPHRGRGLMPEALMTVAQWLFDQGATDIAWECAAGNFASASVARSVGFRYIGTKAANVMYRDGTRPTSWHGSLRANQLGVTQPGWPTETMGPATAGSTDQGTSSTAQDSTSPAEHSTSPAQHSTSTALGSPEREDRP
jgi:RimJ/RimL family protein N-acetyltransferase